MTIGHMSKFCAITSLSLAPLSDKPIAVWTVEIATTHIKRPSLYLLNLKERGLLAHEVGKDILPWMNTCFIMKHSDPVPALHFPRFYSSLPKYFLENHMLMNTIL